MWRYTGTYCAVVDGDYVCKGKRRRRGEMWEERK
jgi:hypothetical protein